MSLTESEHDELTTFRRQALLGVMQDLSEDCWAAGWNSGLERDLYRIVFEDACPEYGMGWINATERKSMRQWALLTDSWWVWDSQKEGGKPKLISLSEAKSRFARIVSKQVPEGLTVREALSLYQLSGSDDWELEPLLERAVPDNSFILWLNRARETYRFKTDPALYLTRRHDFQFVLGYGTCQIDIVQPSWLPTESFLRAPGCTESEPCKHVQLCCACAEKSGIDGD
jgi:hypothetical protein